MSAESPQKRPTRISAYAANNARRQGHEQKADHALPARRCLVGPCGDRHQRSGTPRRRDQRGHPVDECGIHNEPEGALCRSCFGIEPYLIKNQRLRCADEGWRRPWRRPHAFSQKRPEVRCRRNRREAEMDDDVMRVTVGLPNVRFTYTGLLAGRSEGVKRLEPGVDVADLMFDRQGGHWVSLPEHHVSGLETPRGVLVSAPPPAIIGAREECERILGIFRPHA